MALSSGTRCRQGCITIGGQAGSLGFSLFIGEASIRAPPVFAVVKGGREPAAALRPRCLDRHTISPYRRISFQAHWARF
jgi:hypothetical protein